MIRTALLLALLATFQEVDPRLAKLVPPVPTPEGFIADVPGLVPGDARARLNARIRAIQDSGFGDLAVAIIPSVADYQPYEVGLAIYRTWKVGRIDSIGSARRDLGVLLLIVPKELTPDNKGHCWITTGRGAEGILTDAVSARICADRIVPYLKSRDYGGAVAEGIEAISTQLRGDEGLTSQAMPIASGEGRSNGSGIPWGKGLGGMAVLVAAVFAGRRWARNRPRKCPQCGKKMVRLSEVADNRELNTGQQLEEQLASIDYDVWECDCGGAPLILPYKKVLSGFQECEVCKFRTAKTKRKILSQPTYTSSGLAEDTTKCQSCGAVRTKQVVLAKRTRSTSSGGRSSSGSSGGGGSSFGGSGSSGGGGGGSRY